MTYRQTVPMFRKVDLTELKDEGVLLAANERFFWPFGLALTWEIPDGQPGGPASNLHVRQYDYEDGHREGIVSDETDPVYADRQARFAAWCIARVAVMPVGERRRAYAAARKPKP